MNYLGGMATFIEKYQSYVAELESLKPNNYTNDRMKSQLLANIRNAVVVAHLIQACRDNKAMTFEQCASYLKRNSILIDYANSIKTSVRVMLKESSPLSTDLEEKTFDEVIHIFHTMAKIDGVYKPIM